MCDYITATLPAEADRIGLESIVKRNHLDFSVIPNETVISQLKPGETYHHATRSYCDCGTALGSLATSGETGGKSGRALLRKVQRLRSKGWSQSKIDRWLAQRDETEEKRKREAADQAKWHTPDAERWLCILNEMIQSGKTPSVGLLIHWYSRGLESERIEIQKRNRIRIGDATPELMLNMMHDVLYDFTK